MPVKGVDSTIIQSVDWNVEETLVGSVNGRSVTIEVDGSVQGPGPQDLTDALFQQPAGGAYQAEFTVTGVDDPASIISWSVSPYVWKRLRPWDHRDPGGGGGVETATLTRTGADSELSVTSETQTSGTTVQVNAEFSATGADGDTALLDQPVVVQEIYRPNGPGQVAVTANYTAGEELLATKTGTLSLSGGDRALPTPVAGEARMTIATTPEASATGGITVEGVGEANAGVLTTSTGDDDLAGQDDVFDTAVFEGPRDAYTLSRAEDQVIVTGEGRDILRNVDQVRFADETVDPASLADDTDPTFDFQAATAGELVQAIYILYFGRAAEPAGFEFWRGEYERLKEGGTPPLQIAVNFADRFADSQEARQRFPFLTDPSASGADNFVQTVFDELFARQAEPAGEDFFSDRVVAQLDAGEPVGDIVLDVLSSARGADLTTINNRIAGANAFTGTLRENNASYDTEAARALIDGVVADTRSAQAASQGQAAARGLADGSAFSLTAGADEISGTSGNDTITATIQGNSPVLGDGDVVDGGEGRDTLITIFASAAAQTAGAGASLRNLEEIAIRNASDAAATFDGEPVAGLATVIVNERGDRVLISLDADSANAALPEVPGIELDSTRGPIDVRLSAARVDGNRDQAAVTARDTAGGTLTLAGPEGADGLEVLRLTSIGEGPNRLDSIRDGAAESLRVLTVDGERALELSGAGASLTTLDTESLDAPFTAELALGAGGGRGVAALTGNDDTLDLSETGATPGVTILTGVGDDTITATDGADIMVDGPGDDRQQGGDGADVYIGGAGADQYVQTTGDGADTIVYGGAVADRLDIPAAAVATDNFDQLRFDPQADTFQIPARVLDGATKQFGRVGADTDLPSGTNVAVIDQIDGASALSPDEVETVLAGEPVDIDGDGNTARAQGFAEGPIAVLFRNAAEDGAITLAIDQQSASEDNGDGLSSEDTGDGLVTLGTGPAETALAAGAGGLSALQANNFAVAPGQGLTLTGTDASEGLGGGPGDDELSGADGNDQVFGDGGDDTIDGGPGSDRIDGGEGVDALTGGPGVDVFEFDIGPNGIDSGVGQGNRDMITDFMGAGQPGGDVIKFPETLVADTFIGGQDFTANNGDSEVRVTTQDTGPPEGDDVTVVQVDADDDGQAEFEVEVKGVQPLDEGDFMLGP